MVIKGFELQTKEIPVECVPYYKGFTNFCVAETINDPELLIVAYGVSGSKMPNMLRAEGVALSKLDSGYEKILFDLFGNVAEEYYDAIPCFFGGNIEHTIKTLGATDQYLFLGGKAYVL